MIAHIVRWAILAAALAPFAYYLLSAYCGWEYFRKLRKAPPRDPSFHPPVSVLKPVRGLDREAYENFASFCRQEYPEYEILFAVSDAGDPVIPVIEKLMRDFPERPIRLLVGVPRLGASSKVNKLCRLVREARYGVLVMSDSDVRVDPDYLRDAVAPFADARVGAVTTFFRGMVEGGFATELDAVGAPGEFSASALVARKLEGLKFTFGTTMATTKQRLAEIGGFEALVNHHSDDFELGNRIAARGYRVEMMRKPVWMVFPRQTFAELWRHELRWSIGLRNVRPWGHLGLVLTFGLPWALLAALVAPAKWIGAAYLAAYLALRLLTAWIVGVWGLDDPVVRRKPYLVPARDALNFLVWSASFLSNRIEWRGLEFVVEKGLLVPVTESRHAGRAVDASGNPV
jgi:ceramide glucosyltransferase